MPAVGFGCDADETDGRRRAGGLLMKLPRQMCL